MYDVIFRAIIAVASRGVRHRRQDVIPLDQSYIKAILAQIDALEAVTAVAKEEGFVPPYLEALLTQLREAAEAAADRMASLP